MYRILSRALNLYELAILLRVLFSWLNIASGNNEFVKFIHTITEPYLAKIREILYDKLGLDTGMLDLSPVVAILILRLVFKILIRY